MKPTGKKLQLTGTCITTGEVTRVEADVYNIGSKWFASVNAYTNVPIDALWSRYYDFSEEWPILNGWEWKYHE